jgi:hypothetical protein
MWITFWKKLRITLYTASGPLPGTHLPVLSLLADNFCPLPLWIKLNPFSTDSGAFPAFCISGWWQKHTPIYGGMFLLLILHFLLKT